LTDEFFEIAVIPKTWDVTNLSRLRPNDAVNIEVDVLAKYVERMLAVGKDSGSLTLEKLSELGYR
jgi:riboflavin synthase